MNKNKIALGLLVAAAVMGIIIGVSRSKKPEEAVNPEITLESNKMMDSDAGLVPAMSEAEKRQIEDTFAKDGAEMTMLKDVAGGQAVGTAWRNFDGNSFAHKVEVNNLPALEKGYFFEGWLVGAEGFFSTGRMAAIDGQGKLYYKAGEDKSAFKGVVITLEPEDGIEAPDKHIVEGSF
ncbi:MAG: anti-sigma factor [Candidatus Beckwithbacteria bacterium]